MTGPLVSLRAVTRTVGLAAAPIDILNGIDLDVDGSEYVAVTGASGSGKSTLLNVLGLLDGYDAGAYHLFGHDVGRLTSAQHAGLRAHHIGFVFQAFHLLSHRSLLENVMLAGTYARRPIATTGEAVEALDRVGLAHRRHDRPAVMSGGEQQRIAVARAVVKRPRLLLADEPTGNLDSAATTSLLELFDQLHDDATAIVVVTHDPTVARRAQRQVRITDGRLAPTPVSTDHRPPTTREPAQLAPTPRAPVAASPPTTDPTVPSRLTLGRLVGEALAGLAGRPSRALLTGLGTVLGVATLVATVGLGATTGSRIVNRFTELTSTEVIVESGISDTAAIPWDAERRIRRLNGVDAAGTKADIGTAVSVRTAAVNDPGQAPATANLVAASPGLFDAVRTDMQLGHTYNTIHQQLAARVAVVGPALAERLDIERLGPSTTIFIDGAPYIVIGVIADQGVRRAPDLLTAAVIPDTTARRDFDLAALGQVHIDTAVGAAAQVGQEAPTALHPAAPDRLRVLDAQAPTRLRDDTEHDLNLLLVALGAISLLVGAIGIANITLISVLERQGEIGLRTALGARSHHIAGQFLLESGLIGLVAGLVGTAAGITAIVATAALRDWTPVVQPWILLAAPALGAATGIAAGLYPSLRAARTRPADALRAGT